MQILFEKNGASGGQGTSNGPFPVVGKFMNKSYEVREEKFVAFGLSF